MALRRDRGIRLFSLLGSEKLPDRVEEHSDAQLDPRAAHGIRCRPVPLGNPGIPHELGRESGSDLRHIENRAPFPIESEKIPCDGALETGEETAAVTAQVADIVPKSRRGRRLDGILDREAGEPVSQPLTILKARDGIP